VSEKPGNTETLLKDTEIAAAEDIAFGVAYHMRFRSWKADEAIKRCDWLQLMSLLESGAADGAPSADLATTTLERVGTGLISAVAKSDAKKGGGSFAAAVAFAGAARDALQRAPADPARPVWEEELKGQIQVLWAVSRASTAPLTEVEEALEALPQLEGALGVALNTSPGGKVLVGWESAMKKRPHEEAALQCAQAARELFAQVTGHAAGEQWQNWTEEVSRACKKQKEAVSKAGALQEADRHQLAREGRGRASARSRVRSMRFEGFRSAIGFSLAGAAAARLIFSYLSMGCLTSPLPVFASCRGTAFEDVVLGLLLRSPREEVGRAAAGLRKDSLSDSEKQDTDR
jgi:hypothetical protein